MSRSASPEGLYANSFSPAPAPADYVQYPPTASYEYLAAPPSAPGSPSGSRPVSPVMAYPQYPEGDQEVDELVSDEDGNQGRGASQGGADGSDGENDGEEMGSHDEADLEEAEEGTSGWKCEWDGCGREWKEQIGLVRHLEKTHIPRGREKYQCRWYNCLRRGNKPSTRHSLITHCRKHTGHRPYDCNQPNCSKSFTRSDALNKHLRSIHLVPAEEAIYRSTKPRAAPPRPKPKPPQSRASTLNYNPLHMSEEPRHDPMDEEDSFMDLIDPALGPQPPHPDSAQSRDKGKASRSAPSSGRSRHRHIAPQGSQGTPYDMLPSPLQPPVHDYPRSHGHASRHSHSRPSLPPMVNAPPIVAPDGVTYIRYGSDADLMTDPDLLDVIPRIRKRGTVQISQEDQRAIAFVRSRYPRDRIARARQQPPQPPWVEDQPVEPDTDDSFDEGVARFRVDESKTLLGHIGEEGMYGERAVFGRSKWQAKYIMAKAKLMLAEEEMKMRQGELMAISEEENQLRQALEGGGGSTKRKRNTK